MEGWGVRAPSILARLRRRAGAADAAPGRQQLVPHGIEGCLETAVDQAGHAIVCRARVCVRAVVDGPRNASICVNVLEHRPVGGAEEERCRIRLALERHHVYLPMQMVLQEMVKFCSLPPREPLVSCTERTY
jgi:hypothetical protein